MKIISILELLYYRVKNRKYIGDGLKSIEVGEREGETHMCVCGGGGESNHWASLDGLA